MNEIKKTIKLTLAEIVYGLVLIVGIVGSYTLMQYQVSDLDQGRIENRIRIEKLEERVRLQEIEISKMNESLKSIGNDVTVIKNAVLDASFRAGK